MVVIKPRILCFVACYLPGYRGGGPVRTIANFVEYLGDEFDISIVTRDRDISDTSPYSGVAIDNWNRVGKAKVFYASKKMRNFRGTAKLLRETPHDVLYLNSFFDMRFSILPLVARRFGLAPSTPCLIAPRGEFSKGAISLKAPKKHLYIKVARAFGLYHGLSWQASSDYERRDICRELGLASHQVQVAPNVTPIVSQRVRTGCERASGPLRLVFLSRISPKKNLNFLLRVLGKVSEAVYLTTYGPKEDQQYWQRCEALIEQLPENVNVRVRDEVQQQEVQDKFSQHDVFVFPTRGENFGHVIFEALTAGTPVLVSDQTPWQPDAQGALQVLPLDESLWVYAIEEWARLNGDSLAQRRIAAGAYCDRYCTADNAVEITKQLFYVVLKRG